MEFLHLFLRRHFKGEDRGGIAKCWLFSQVILTCSSIVRNLYFVFYFSPISINYKLLTTENEIILNRRGEHLGRLILHIMTKKNRYSIDIILRTAEQIYIYSRLPITRTFKGNRKKFELSGVNSNISTEWHNNLSVHI